MSARLKLSIQRATLEVEASTLRARQSLEQAEMELMQRRREVGLQEKLAMADAQERTYAAFARAE
jgi:hypothetical protein